ncbi:MAG: UDP-N-acetylmuramoyl-L-alanine--D-glutamate ligase [Lachnospiraceae bacterium]|nr:UDP-N-acetylmuramoyl-L-alanine--D-glutamate ligase [Lachnospiraceae bacterium]
MRDTYLVAGCSISGIGAARLLLKTGASVILYDGNVSLDPEKIREKLAFHENVSVVLGELSTETAKVCKACVISPGIPLRMPFVQVLRECGVPIWSEIELAYRFGKGKVAAITGTNGKTTTTALVGELLAAHYPSSFVVGNIGIPYTEKALEMSEESVTVAEVSSFQLETIVDFHPAVSAITNITPDHLDRHLTMESYIEVKESVTKNQMPDEVCVLNYEDPVLRAFGEQLDRKVIFFSSARELTEGLFLRDDHILFAHDGVCEDMVATDELQILGRHNYENAMTAIAVGWAMGVPVDTIRSVLRRFQPVEHRIEFTVEKDGVAYYNDSKGTNPDAAIQAVKAMVRPTVLIAGGYDKGSDYDEWIASFGDRVKALVLLGQTADKIEEAARKAGFTNILRAESMEEAVKLSAKAAVPGDAVLLSPACASWGMFKNYEERGRIFKELARAL